MTNTPNHAPCKEIDSLQQTQITEIANEVVNRKLKSWNRITIFWGILFLFIMIGVIVVSMWYIADLGNTISLEITNAAKLIAEDVYKSSLEGPTATTVGVTVERTSLLSADYLAVVLPVLVALAGSLVAFLGMNRLKMYDERIDKTRSDLIKELETMVRHQVAADRTLLTKEVEATISDQRKQLDESMIQAKRDLEQLKCEHIESIEQAGDGFNWLKDVIANKIADLNLHTVYDAHKLIETLRREKPNDYMSIIKKIVDRVCNKEPLSGDSADYHNLSAELARGSLYYETTRVLQRSLTLFADDTDLLADLIEYATKGGMLDIAKDALDKLEVIDRRLWTWRCYTFSSAYYRATGDLDKAYELCNDCIIALPCDEHGYSSKAEVEKLLSPGMEGIENSIATLCAALDANINCPQCANALSETYLALGRYSEALDASNRAVLELAQDQPHVSISYVFYQRASTKDRMFLQKLKDDVVEYDLVIGACKDYNAAIDFKGLTATVTKQALHRLAVLTSFFQVDEEN